MKVKEIRWKRQVPTGGIDAERAYNALETIRSKNGGLTDDAVVDAARPKNHTLHKWFEWDDNVAAQEHRRNQARLLIRSIEVVYEEAPAAPSRAYQVHRKTGKPKESRTVYNATEDVLADPESRDQLIARAIRQAMEFRRRFQGLHELDRIVNAIDETLMELGNGE